MKHLKAILLFALSILLSLFISTYLINDYKKEMTSNLSNLVDKIILNHPELELEIIETIKDKDLNLNTLDKYGIDKDTLMNINKYNDFKNKIILINIVFVSIIFILFLFTYLYKINKYKKHRDKLIKYINAILNDDFNFNFNDYEETEESIELNTIYQLTNKLKTQRDDYNKEKKLLETTLSDISHQIKTPLTSLLVINNILSKAVNNVDKKKFLNQSNSQLNRIDWLVSSLLKLAKIDSKTIKFKKEKIKLINLLKDLKKDLEINLELKQLKLNINCDDSINIINDYYWLKEAIFNILKNDIEHAYENTNIDINVFDNPIYTEINIVNNGDTIDEKDIKNLFKRFYKGKNSSPQSIGIGLNMSKNIIENNRGNIKAISKDNFTTFEIKIYKNVN